MVLSWRRNLRRRRARARVRDCCRRWIVASAVASAPALAGDVCSQIGDGTTAPSATQTGLAGLRQRRGGKRRGFDRARQTVPRRPPPALLRSATTPGPSRPIATALGSNAQVTAASGTALGSNTQAFGLRSTAVGYSAQGLSEGAVAIGFNSYVGPAATGSVALGYGARATEANVFSRWQRRRQRHGRSGHAPHHQRQRWHRRQRRRDDGPAQRGGRHCRRDCRNISRPPATSRPARPAKAPLHRDPARMRPALMRPRPVPRARPRACNRRRRARCRCNR